MAKDTSNGVDTEHRDISKTFPALYTTRSEGSRNLKN